MLHCYSISSKFTVVLKYQPVGLLSKVFNDSRIVDNWSNKQITFRDRRQLTRNNTLWICEKEIIKNLWICEKEIIKNLWICEKEITKN